MNWSNDRSAYLWKILMLIVHCEREFTSKNIIVSFGSLWTVKGNKTTSIVVMTETQYLSTNNKENLSFLHHCRTLRVYTSQCWKVLIFSQMTKCLSFSILLIYRQRRTLHLLINPVQLTHSNANIYLISYASIWLYHLGCCKFIVDFRFKDMIAIHAPFQIIFLAIQQGSRRLLW